MKTEEEKQTWVTPEIVDLDVRETKSGTTTFDYEDFSIDAFHS